jgi:hypothetical protein
MRPFPFITVLSVPVMSGVAARRPGPVAVMSGVAARWPGPVAVMSGVLIHVDTIIVQQSSTVIIVVVVFHPLVHHSKYLHGLAYTHRKNNTTRAQHELLLDIRSLHVIFHSNVKKLWFHILLVRFTSILIHTSCNTRNKGIESSLLYHTYN